jgi:excisionase family DNA binding protein
VERFDAASRIAERALRRSGLARERRGALRGSTRSVAAESVGLGADSAASHRRPPLAAARATSQRPAPPFSEPGSASWTSPRSQNMASVATASAGDVALTRGFSSHEVAMSASSIPPRRSLTREDVLDAQEVADLLHMPLSTVLDFARRGILPGHKLGRRWIFLRDELEAGVREAPGSLDFPTRPERPAYEAARFTRNLSKRR